jgi:hypothetical protein
MVFHTTFLLYARPAPEEKIDGWEFSENLSRFSGGEDYHKQDARDAGRIKKLENGKGKMEIRKGL